MNSQPAAIMGDEAIGIAGPSPAVPANVSATFAVSVTQRIEDVEAIWRDLTAAGVESPGQDYDFIRHWITHKSIQPDDQRFVVAEMAGRPIALLPLHRKTISGVRVLTWFPGSQVGAYAPIADMERLAALTSAQRKKLWAAMVAPLKGADLLFLRSVPQSSAEHAGLFDELGSNLATETLYRASFSSWEQCDGEQRSRSRRKHDRQQGDRLAALGAVDFEEVSDPATALAAVDLMFKQRSARFKEQRIRDPFVSERLIGFYRDALSVSSGIDVRLHTLRLDGDIVAVRYNVVKGDRMFCLISSMADCERIQTGSPGKQCLLRVMQTVFAQGIRIFDMGAGFTDEKRHWCNVQVPLRQHYIALTPQGSIVAAAHRNYHVLRARAKAHAGIKTALRNAMAKLNGIVGRGGARSE